MSVIIPSLTIYTFPTDEAVGTLENVYYTEVQTSAGMVRSIKSKVDIPPPLWLLKSLNAYQSWWEAETGNAEPLQPYPVWRVLLRFNFNGSQRECVATVQVGFGNVAFHIQ